MPEANPKGEVTLQLDGHDEPFKLSFTFDDFADADELLGRPVLGDLSGGGVRLSTIRTLLYVGARPDKRIPAPEAVRGLISFKNIKRVSDAVMESANAALAEGSDPDEVPDLDPTQAADGALTTST